MKFLENMAGTEAGTALWARLGGCDRAGPVPVATVRRNPKPRPPCAHEGQVVSWCTQNDESRHRRVCLNDATGLDTCSRAGECATCAYHAPATMTGMSGSTGGSQVKTISRVPSGRKLDSTQEMFQPSQSAGNGRQLIGSSIGDTSPRIVARFDETTLWPGVGGLRFNSSLLAWRDGYLFAARTGWAGSDILIGRLDRNLSPVGPPSRLKLTHPMASHGREDPILCVHDGRPHVFYVGVTNPPIRTHVLYARLSEDGMTAEEVFYPEYRRRKEWEKSHVPFSYDGTLYAVYSFAPETRILRISGNKATTAFSSKVPGVPYQHGEIRGGSTPTQIGDELFFFCHSHTYPIGPQFWRKYHTLVVTLEAKPPFRLKRMTPVPVSSADPKTRPRPRKGQAVEFVRGAVFEAGRWLVSAGIHDRTSQIAEFQHAAIESALGRVTPPAWFAIRRGSWDDSVFVWNNGIDEYRLRGLDLSGCTVVDVGGHIGSFVLAAHDRGARVIHSYEPNAESFALLRRNCDYLGVQAFNAGVGAEAGVCRSEPYDGQVDHTGGYRAVMGEGTTPVVGIQEVLSRACAASRDGYIDILKLDCEGAEFPILETPGLDLSRVRRIIGEAHGGPKARALLGRDYTLRSVVPLVERHGFRVTDLQEGSTPVDGLFWAERP
jgi:FkbM family methyltransferase